MVKKKDGEQTVAAAFFASTLLLWSFSVAFEIFFNQSYQLILVFSSFIFFQFANVLVRRCASRGALFVNTCISLLHASIISTSVLLILIYQWRTIGISQMFEHSQLAATWPWAYQVVCISCGYFAYDQLDMLLHGLYSGLLPPILLHHLVLLICFTLALYRRTTINYLILTLICELHSVFLHVRKVRRMCGIRGVGSRMVRMEWMLNWVTFTSARLIPHIVITVKLIRDAPLFDKGVGLPLALFGMAGMNVLNVFLGVDLLHAYQREARPPESHRWP